MLKRSVSLCLVVCLLLINATVHAQTTNQIQINGTFSIPDSFYSNVKMLVGLTDTSGLFSTDPVYIAPRNQQMLGQYTGQSASGSYTITLPLIPRARPFDVTGGNNPTPNVRIFDIRLLTNVGERDHMVPNEDPLASSLNISIDWDVTAGSLFVWTADDKQQFPTDFGKDNKLFTVDDPRTVLPAGWSIVNLGNRPFTITQNKTYQINLKTTALADIVDYQTLSCAKLVPTLIDRAEHTYPFTALHAIDWHTIRDKLVPAAASAQNDAECEKVILDLANSIPDNHVYTYLPALNADYAGSVGMTMAALTDGQIIVSALWANGPAIKAGIRTGATIIKWDNKPIHEALKSVVLFSGRSGVPHVLVDYQLFDLTLGMPSSSVKVTYQNPGENEKTATLIRTQTGNNSTFSLYVRERPPQVMNNKLPSGFGYIDIDGFREVSMMDRVDAAIDQLIKDNVRGIILDLRPNSGGLSQMSDALASRFFDKEITIDRLKLADGRTVYQDQIEPRLPVYKGCLVMLVELYTASAGDLFAYTFKSQKRATLIGNTPTWGGGGTISGGIYQLPAGATMWIPTGGFYDEQNHLVVEGTGVSPDITVPLTRESIFSPQDEVLDAGVNALKECTNKP